MRDLTKKPSARPTGAAENLVCPRLFAAPLAGSLGGTTDVRLTGKSRGANEVCRVLLLIDCLEIVAVGVQVKDVDQILALNLLV